MRCTRIIKLILEVKDESEASESFLHAEMRIAEAMRPFGITTERAYSLPGVSAAQAIESAVNSIGSGSRQ